MGKIIESDEDFTVWLQGFLPQLFEPEFSLAVGEVRDKTDGKLVHLDGLNFSRAWCLYNIAARQSGPPRCRGSSRGIATLALLCHKEPARRIQSPILGGILLAPRWFFMA